MNDIVDIFIPVSTEQINKLPMAFHSAINQTYKNIRIVIFFDGVNEEIDAFFEKNMNNSFDGLEKTDEDYLIEYYDKIVTIKNFNGPSGTGAIARQWYFKWNKKSNYVKFLDADDLLLSNTIEIMMKYFDDKVDGVFCPLFAVNNNIFREIVPGKPKLGHAGSGSMLLKKSCIDDIIEKGFVWPNKKGHDNDFLIFCQDKYNFKTTNENVLYIYLK